MTQVDLLLARCVLVEAVLDGNAERLERADRLLAQLAGHVARGEIEVAALIDRHRRLAGNQRLEVEELDVRRDVERQTVVVGLLHVTAQHLSRVALEGRAVEVVDVAEDPCLRRLGVAPRQQLERVGVGHRQHVGFLHAREPVDRRPVEGHAVLECVLQLGRRDGETLERAQHVGEPEAHEPDAAFFDAAQDVVALLLAHVGHLLSLSRPGSKCDRTGAAAPVLSSFGVRSRRRDGVPTHHFIAPQMVSTISRATMYGSMLALGRRSSR